MSGVSPICERTLGRISGRIEGVNVCGDFSFVPMDQVHLDGRAGDLKTNVGGVKSLIFRPGGWRCCPVVSIMSPGSTLSLDSGHVAIDFGDWFPFISIDLF